MKCDNHVSDNGLEVPYILSADGMVCKMPLLDEFKFCKEIDLYKGVTSCTAC